MPRCCALRSPQPPNPEGGKPLAFYTPVSRPFVQSAGRMHPLGRVGRAEEIAAMIVMLASADSSWTTGSLMVVDGGISLS